MTRISETSSNVELYNQNISAGVVGVVPVLTDNHNGTCDISACDVLLYDNASFIGGLKKYHVDAQVGFDVSDTPDQVRYIAIDYNSGNPIYVALLFSELSGVTFSDVTPMFTVYNEANTSLHILDWDSMGQGLSDKLNMRLTKVDRFARESGLVLTTSGDGSMGVFVSSGVVWVGAIIHDMDAFNSATIGHEWHFWQKTGVSTWTNTAITDGSGTFNNTQYNTTAGALVTISNNNYYTVNWIYRDLDGGPHCGYVLGEQEFTTLSAASASQPRTDLPPEFGVMSTLVGRVIVQKNITTAAIVESSFTREFIGAQSTEHNFLAGLQGGEVSAYYHSNQAINKTNTVLFDGLVLPKTTGKGIKVDVDVPTWPWRDLEGIEVVDIVATNSATLTLYNTPVREFAYSAADIMDIRFHVPHDYVPGTDMYLHVHWSHNGTAISGTFSTTFTSVYAKGHNQSDFSAPKVVGVSYNTVDIATTPRYRHRIEEVVFTTPTPGGTATLIDSALIEADGLILCQFQVTGTPTITGGTANEPFVHRVDIHYQSNNVGTKQKSSPFWT